MLALSATFSAEALAGAEALMRRPQRVLLAPDSVSLLGVRQFYALVPGALRITTIKCSSRLYMFFFYCFCAVFCAVVWQAIVWWLCSLVW